MSSGTLPPDLERDDEQNSSRDAGRIDEQDATEWDSCLDLLERVRERGGSTRADWLFGSDAGLDRTGGVNSDTTHEAGTELPRRIGRFEIERRLGRGGYGIVLLARDPELNRRVALKVPNPAVLMREELQRQFLREGEAAAALNHPHIVTVHEAGQVGALNYIASEYVEGETLAEWLSAHSERIDPSEAARIVKVLADAVQHAHGRGVLHRDIKPGNVLLQGSGTSRLPAAKLAAAARLTDFGLARIEDSHHESPLAESSKLLGTPAYMSPEQAAGRTRDVDATSDIYALGVILYELLVGETPFRKATRQATLDAIQHDDVVPPSRRASRTPADLEAVVLKCLEKDRERRYSSPAALSEDLERFLNGESVTARRATTLETIGRWRRRNPAVATLLSLVTMLTVVIAVGSSLAAFQLSDSRRQVLDHLEEEIRARDEATRSEELALRTLFEARVAQARAGLRSGAPGQRMESLAALESAASLIPRLGLSDNETRLLRNGVIAGLSLIDLTADAGWPADASEGVAYATDADVERYAQYQPERGSILIHRLEDNHVLAELPQDGPGVEIRQIQFSPDGDYLGCVWDRDGKAPRLQIWNLSEERMIHMSIVRATRSRPFDFGPDGDRIAAVRPDGSVELLALPDVSVVHRLTSPEPSESPRFNVDGSKIAVRRSTQLEIVDSTSGRTTQSLECRGYVWDVNWSGNGRLLAAAHDGSVTIWRIAAGMRPRRLSHPGDVAGISFHPDSNLLATYCATDRRTRLWDVNGGRQLLSVREESSGFSRDGVWLGRPAGRWRVSPRNVHRVLLQPRLSGAISSTGQVSLHPDGRLLAASNRSQTIFWDLARAEPVAEMRVNDGTGVFSPDGKHFIMSTTEGLFLRPISGNETDGEISFRIGAPEPLGVGGCGSIAVTQDSGVIACADRYHLRRVTLFNAHTGFTGILEHTNARWIHLAPGGNLLATGAWRGINVNIWDPGTGELLRTIPTSDAQARFSPCGEMLAIDEGSRFSVLSTEDWAPVHSPLNKETGHTDPGSMAFSPDGRLVSVLAAPDVIVLLDTSDSSELARFQLPHAIRAESLTIGPRGDRLIAGVRGGSRSALHVWDLLELRRQLARMGLDWDHPALSERPDESRPLEFVMDQ